MGETAMETFEGTGLDVRDVVKSYTGTTVLKGVSIAVRPGEIVGFVGHNGAGKSTLMRVISGATRPDSGSITIDGQPVAQGSPTAAIEAGIATVYQELSLLPNLTISQNVFLGAEQSATGFLKKQQMRSQAQELVRRFGLDVDVDRKVSDFPVATRQLLEIAIATHRKARYLMLDEPTTSLEGRQVDNFLETVKDLSADGLGIVLVNHKLEELYAVATRIVALVDGEIRIDSPIGDVSRDDVIRAIAGEEAVALNSASAQSGTQRRDELDVADVVVRVQDLHSNVLKGVTCEARAGRVLGIYGLVGSGRTELLRSLIGADRVLGGSVTLFGASYQPSSPRSAMKRGIVYVTEERKQDGIIPQLDSTINTMLPVLKQTYRWGLLDRRQMAKRADEVMNTLHVLGNRDAPVASLSGGNQQKVLLARALAQKPRVLLLDEPTKGVDLGVKGEIHRMIKRLAHEEGLTVILVSSEEEEICDVADDVIVMSHGRATGDILDPASLTAASLRQAAWEAA